MKKLFCMIALAAITFGSVYAHGVNPTVKPSMQQDTTKKKKTKPMKDSTSKKKKDTTAVKPLKLQ
jgi:hypothetical protein